MQFNCFKNDDLMHIPNCSIIFWHIDLTVVVTEDAGETDFMVTVTIITTGIKCGVVKIT
jgi:hypothetical protein